MEADNCEQALSNFAEYVEQQQSIRFPGSAKSAPDTAQHHAELDELFDNLDLTDSAPSAKLKDLLLSPEEDSLKKLEKVLTERLEEGYGETVFELGFDNNGDSMQLGLEEWNTAYGRLVEASRGAHAECLTLLTKNVGGDMEAVTVTASQPDSKEKSSCSGKILIRREPINIEDVIETRIAVVGNGKLTTANFSHSDPGES